MRLTRVASLAPFLLLTVISSSAYAQAVDPPPEGGGEGNGVPEYLHKPHYDDLLGRIEAARSQVEELRAQLTSSAKDGEAGSNATVVGELQVANELLARLLSEAEQTRHDRDASHFSPWAGWHWGIGLLGSGVVLTGDSDYAALGELMAFARWVDGETHLGLEAGAQLGMWPTEDVAPFTGGGHLYGVAAWEHWGLVLGPSFHGLQEVDGDGSLLLVVIEAGPEVNYDGAFIRFTPGWSVFSERARTSGLWLGGVVGYYFK